MIKKLSKEEWQQMDVDSLTCLVFRYLKSKITSNPDGLGFLPVERLRQELFQDAGKHNPVQLLEAIVLLETRGLVVRDIPCPARSFREEENFIVHLTSIGMKSECEEIVLLVDSAQEVVNALEQKIGRLDDVVRQYYLESLRAYQEGLYISSVICLGAASERAIHWLAEAIETNFQNYQTKIQAKRNGQIAALTKYLSDTVIPNIPNFDKKFADELRKRLGGLAGVYRENRNEAGHPTTVEQSWLKDDQEILLLHFRRYITTISTAIAKCYSKSGTAGTI